MDKIVIVTNRPQPDHSLFGLLNTLFPECEVDIVSRQTGTFEEDPAGCSSGSFTAHTTGEGPDGKH
ncbi:MAG: hypothetical protein BA872_06005 [Desulfobacterales bacterium C00003060]|nr:MAG: hypothetical protein BA872_06005 [Desulfobacterales bacterium C00003060]